MLSSDVVCYRVFDEFCLFPKKITKKQEATWFANCLPQNHRRFRSPIHHRMLTTSRKYVPDRCSLKRFYLHKIVGRCYGNILSRKKQDSSKQVLTRIQQKTGNPGQLAHALETNEPPTYDSPIRRATSPKSQVLWRVVEATKEPRISDVALRSHLMNWIHYHTPSQYCNRIPLVKVVNWSLSLVFNTSFRSTVQRTYM